MASCKKMENGEWRMENGKWKMENGKWKILSRLRVRFVVFVLIYNV